MRNNVYYPYFEMTIHKTKDDICMDSNIRIINEYINDEAIPSLNKKIEGVLNRLEELDTKRKELTTSRYLEIIMSDEIKKVDKLIADMAKSLNKFRTELDLLQPEKISLLKTHDEFLALPCFR